MTSSKPVASGVEEWDIETTADKIAREIAKIDGGRIHADWYSMARAGALEALKTARAQRDKEFSALLPKATAPVVIEPVAWVRQKTIDRLKDMHSGATDTQLANIQFDAIGCSVPLYASPPPLPEVTEAGVRRAWTAFNDKRHIYHTDAMRAALEAFVKEA